MKRLIFSLVASLYLLVSFPSPASPATPEVTLYYTLSAVDEDKRGTVEEALNHMEDKVSCINFEPYNGEKVNNNMILQIVSVSHFAGPIVGMQTSYLYLGDSRVHSPILFLANNTKSVAIKGKLVPVTEDFLFKVVLHEVTHALGMDGLHAFPRFEADETHFSPVISHKSGKYLFERDIEYLENLVCRA